MLLYVYIIVIKLLYQRHCDKIEKLMLDIENIWNIRNIWVTQDSREDLNEI